MQVTVVQVTVIQARIVCLQSLLEMVRLREGFMQDNKLNVVYEMKIYILIIVYLRSTLLVEKLL